MDVNKKLRRSEARDKRLRYSIRKFNVGVASVAVAAFFMVGGSSAAANEVTGLVSGEETSAALVDESGDGDSEDADSSAGLAAVDSSVLAGLVLNQEQETELSEAETPSDLTESSEAAKGLSVTVRSVDASTEKEEAELSTELPSAAPAIDTKEAKGAEASETKGEEKAAEAVETRLAATTYRVRYVDEATGEVVYQRNYSASEETAAPVGTPHDFKLSVALELDTAAALRGYVLSDSQELAIRDNAIAAIVTERGSNRTLKVGVRRDFVAASGKDEDKQGKSGFRATETQAAGGAEFNTSFANKKYESFSSVLSHDGRNAVFVVGDGVGPLGVTYFGKPEHRAAANTLWTSGDTRQFLDRDENGMFSTGRSDFTRNREIGLNVAHQINMVSKGYGYDQGIDEVQIDFKDYFVLDDELARQGYKMKIVDFRETNVPTGLSFDYKTGVLSGKIQTGGENGGNYIGVKVALLNPAGVEVSRTDAWIDKFNIVYQDRTAPTLEVEGVANGTVNEALSLPMIYETQEEQNKAKEEFDRGDREIFLTVKDNGWALPYGDAVRDQSGRIISYIGKQSLNAYFNHQDTDTTVNAIGLDRNAVMSLEAGLRLKEKTAGDGHRQEIRYDYETGTLNISSNVAGIYEVTLTANDYKFIRDAAETNRDPWNFVTTPQETTKTFTVHINPTITVSDVDTAAESLTVTLSGGVNKASVTLPDGTIYNLTETNGKWLDDKQQELVAVKDENLVTRVTLPVDYRAFTRTGEDAITATASTVEGLTGRGTAAITNTPPSLQTKGGNRTLGETVNLLSSEFIVGIQDTEDDHHNDKHPNQQDDKLTKITSIVVVSPDGERQTYTGADMKSQELTLDRPGTYSVTVTATDSDGESTNSTYDLSIASLQEASIVFQVRRIFPAALDAAGNVINPETGVILSKVKEDGTHDYQATDGSVRNGVLRQEGNAILNPDGRAIFFSDEDGEVIRTETRFGQSGERIAGPARNRRTGVITDNGFHIQDILNEYKKNGYEVVSNDFNPAHVYDTDNAAKQTYTIILREQVVEINERVRPGRLVIEGDPNSPKIPESIVGIKTEERVTRTINYRFVTNDADAAPKNVETLEYSRPAYVNLVTGELTYGSWTPKTTDTFKRVPSPRVSGFLDQNQVSYSSSTVSIEPYTVQSAEEADREEFVYYSTGDNVAFVQYVDKSTGDVLIGGRRHQNLGAPDGTGSVIDFDPRDWLNGQIDTSAWIGEMILGNSNEPLAYSTQATVNELAKRGYTLASPTDDELATAHEKRKPIREAYHLLSRAQHLEYGIVTPLTSDYQIYRVNLSHRIETVSPERPGDAGRPVDASNPNSPVWPEVVRGLVLTKEVNREVIYEAEDGSVLGVTRQKASFRRTADIDLVTGQLVRYSDWSEAQPLPAVKSEVIPEYFTETVTVPALPVTGDSLDVVERVVYKKLGSYVINVPGQTIPVKEVYPNHATEADKVGEPTTVVRFIDGYFPTTADGERLTPVNAEDLTKGYKVPDVPADKSKDTVISYTADKQVAKFIFQVQGDVEVEVLETVPVEGQSSKAIDYSTEDKIAFYEAKGYELDLDTFNPGTVYDTDASTDQEFTITFVERVVPITAGATPGQPVVDPKNPDAPNKPLWPETLAEKEVVEKILKRTITYVKAKDKSRVFAPVEQQAKFSREAFVNLVTGELSYGNWSAPVGLNEVASPALKGFVADSDVVSTTALRATGTNVNVVVNYTELGSYDFTIPQTRPQKTSEQYPNSEFSPSRIGQVTTLAPFIEGYFPTYAFQLFSDKIVDVKGDSLPLLNPEKPEEGYTLNLVDPADPSKGYVVPAVPANVTEHVQLTYVGNIQKAKVRYLAKGEEALGDLHEPTTLSGRSNVTIDATKVSGQVSGELTPDDVIDALRLKGWYLSRSTDNPLRYGGEKHFDENDKVDQEFISSFLRRGERLDPNSPREVIDFLGLEAIGKRTVSYEMADGTTPPADVEQVATFVRFALVDQETLAVMTTNRFLLVHREYDVKDGKITVEGQDYPVENQSVTVRGEEYPVSTAGKVLIGTEYEVSEDGTVTIEGVTYRHGFTEFLVADKSATPALAGDKTKANFSAVPSNLIPGYIVTDVKVDGKSQAGKTVEAMSLSVPAVAKGEKPSNPETKVLVTYSKLGNLIVNEPGQAAKTTPYPNDPSNPAAIGQLTTVIRPIAGYTAVLVQDPTNPASAVTALALDASGQPITPTPENPTKDTVVRYEAKAQVAVIKYVDASGKDIAPALSLTGKTDEPILGSDTAGQPVQDPTAATIAELVKKGYQLVDNSFKPGAMFDTLEDSQEVQEYIVRFKEATAIIDPTVPGFVAPVAGQPVDGQPDSPVWPEAVTNLELSKDLVRTITYAYAGGVMPAETMTDTKTFTQAVTVNLATGEVIDGTWSPAQTFAAKATPRVEGYIADLKEVAAAEVTHASDNIALTVTYSKVGNVVIQTPGQATPILEAYPVNAEDPTMIDQPMTVVPVVAGYTAVLVQDPTNPESTVTALPVGADGQPVLPFPTRATQDTVVAYRANQQEVVITYVNKDKGNAVLHTDRVTGQSDSLVAYSTQPTLASLTKMGYVLVEDGFVAGTTFDREDALPQTFTLILAEGSAIIDPTVPGFVAPVAGQPVDGQPDSPVWPEAVTNLELSKDLVRTITYAYAGGVMPAETMTDTKTFTQAVTVNLATGEVTDGTWSPAQTFAAKATPRVEGYIADLKEVATAEVTHASDNIALTVTYSKVGNVVIQTPGQATPILEAYPVNAEDPTMIDQPMTVVPVVAGYTAVLVQDPTNPESTVTALPVDADGQPVLPFPTRATQDTVVAYRANQQEVVITYVNKDKGNAVLHTDRVTGQSDSLVAYSTQPTLASLTKMGYVLVEDGFVAGTSFDREDALPQTFTLILAEGVVEIPNGAEPGQSLDQNDPNSPVWPNNVSQLLKEQGEKVVTRRISYRDDKGIEVSSPVTQLVTYTRPVFLNLVTAEVASVGDWTSSQPTFEAVTSPAIDGLTADRPIVDVLTTTASMEDVTEVVTYENSATQTAVIVYEFKDKDGRPSKGQETVIDSVTGPAKTAIDYRTDERIMTFRKAGFVLVKDDFVTGSTFDEDDKMTQRFLVTFVEATREVTVEDSVKPMAGQPVDPTDSASPVWPASIEDLSLSANQIRTITYLDATGKEVAAPVVQTLSFTRQASVNLATGAIVYGAWGPTSVEHVEQQTSPVITGYLADQALVPSAQLSAEGGDVRVVVTYNKLGGVVIHVPGQEMPLVVSYPNKSDHPSEIDQLKVALPVVPGFKPVLVVDPADHNSPVLSLAMDADGKSIVPVPANPRVDTVISYLPNLQMATINFVNKDKADAVLHTEHVTGESNQVISYSVEAQIAALTEAGYVFEASDLAVGSKFDQNDKTDQTFTVSFRELVQTIDPTKPLPKAGDAINPADSHSPKWPSSVDSLMLSESISRTITYRDAAGKEVAAPVIETLVFTRSAQLNLATGAITYGDWMPTAGYGFGQQVSPVISGYLADQASVAAVTLDADAADIQVIVTYSKLGHVVIHLPGNDTPTIEAYPNKPGHPSEIDQPKVALPVVPGFKPVLVVNPDAADSSVLPLELDAEGNLVIPSPADPTKDTVIRYLENEKGRVLVRYVDADGQAIRPEVVDIETTLTDLPYDTSDNRLQEVITDDGTRYVLVPSKTSGSETGIVMAGTHEVTYHYVKVGYWVSNVPGQSETLMIPYPFDPEADPAQVGKDGKVSVIPHVSGYVPVDAKGQPLAPVDSNDPSKGYLPPVPTNLSENTVITYKEVTPEKPTEPVKPEVPKPMVSSVAQLPNTGEETSSAALLGAVMFGAAIGLAVRKRNDEEV